MRKNKITNSQDKPKHSNYSKVAKNILIVACSDTRLNSMSKDAQMSIQNTLSKRYSNVSICIVDTVIDLARLVKKKPDLVILGTKVVLLEPLKGYDESAKIMMPSFLTEKGINFTGSDTEALELEYDKPAGKQRVINSGLQSAAYFVSYMSKPTFNHNLSFPLFVKPTDRGDSRGIDERSIVNNQAEMESKILSTHKDGNSNALVEEYLAGREFSIAVIRQPGTNELRAMPIEITSPKDDKGNSFLSEAVKNADTEKVLKIDDEQIKAKISALAAKIFTALGARDYGRIDMRMDHNGVPNFIESNLMPGLSTHGYLSRCLHLNEGITYDDMIYTITDLALERS